MARRFRSYRASLKRIRRLKSAVFSEDCRPESGRNAKCKIGKKELSLSACARSRRQGPAQAPGVRRVRLDQGARSRRGAGRQARSLDQRSAASRRDIHARESFQRAARLQVGHRAVRTMRGDQFVARKRSPPIALAARDKDDLALFIGEPIERLLDG
jgi:hypothetical protein